MICNNVTGVPLQNLFSYHLYLPDASPINQDSYTLDPEFFQSIHSNSKQKQ